MSKEIKVKIIGKPTLDSLSASEKEAYCALLYMKIQELIANGGKPLQNSYNLNNFSLSGAIGEETKSDLDKN